MLGARWFENSRVADSRGAAGVSSIVPMFLFVVFNIDVSYSYRFGYGGDGVPARGAPADN